MPAGKDEDVENEAPPKPLDEGDIALLKTYGQGPYTSSIKSVEDDIKKNIKTCQRNVRSKRIRYWTWST